MKKVELKKVKYNRKSVFFFSLFILCALSACVPAILGPEDLLRINDKLAPVITLAKPVPGSYYAALVSVEGKAEDMADNQASPGEVLPPLHYEVIGTNISGDVALGADGSFNFSFSTSGLVEDKTLRLTVTDWNGNTGEIKITLKAGALADFMAEPGNQSVYIAWEPVDVAENYTLFYTDTGITPSETNYIGDDPVEIGPECLTDTGYEYYLDGLVNGKLYSFLLRANIPGASPDWSQVVQAVPVSHFTLAPHITGGYKKITVQWDAIPGINSFILSRATEKEGPYTDFSAGITGTTYDDTQVTDGIVYYYKVRPALEKSISSGSNSGETVPVPPFGQLLKTYDTPGFAYDIQLRGNLAYVADKDKGLLIIDISQQANPLFKGKYDTPGNALALAIDGVYTYIADDDSKLQIVNIADPANPQFAGYADFAGYAYDVAVKADRAYVAAGSGGVVLVDITDRSAPDAVATLGSEAANGIALSGDYAYVADGSAGLRIIRIADPDTLEYAGSCDTGGTSYDVAVAGDYAYVADGAAGLQIISIADKENPAITGSCGTTGNAIHITLDGNYAFLADDTAGMLMIDITDPAAPRIAGSYNDASCVKAAVTRGQYSYLACKEAGMRIINTGGPHRMQAVCDYNSIRGVKRMDISGRYAFLADGSNKKLHVLDITNPVVPAPAAVLDLPQGSTPYDVAVCGDYAFVTGNLMELQIVCIENPREPYILSTAAAAEGMHNTMDAVIQGDYVYVLYTLTSGSSGVKIFNIADPEYPAETGVFTVENNGQAVRIKDNYLYTANYTKGLHITDISSPSGPRFYKQVAAPRFASDVELFDDYALVADGYEGIRLINIQDPFYPERVLDSGILGKGFASDAALGSYYALAAYGASKKLLVINIDKPAAPLYMGSLLTSGKAQYITARGKYAYLTLEDKGLQIIDLWPFTE